MAQWSFIGTPLADQMTGVIQYWFTIICFTENAAGKTFIGLSLLFFLPFEHNAPILADQVQKVPGLALFRQ